LEYFIDLLRRHRIEAVADVRSTPYSRRQPQFNRNDLQSALKAAGIAYLFLGKELGARSEDSSCYEEGRVKFRRLARTARFRSGLDRVMANARRMNVALMCAEKEPLDCHRTVLVARELIEAGSTVDHILEDGRLEPHEDTIRRLFTRLKLPERDLFLGDEELLDQVYAEQEKRIAYTGDARVREMQEMF